jgi:hypothetical protein
MQEARWDRLTASEIGTLQNRLYAITPRLLFIACETPNCADLADSFREAFAAAGWPQIEVHHGGGLGISGVVGIFIDLGDDKGRQIKDAIESSTTLRVLINSNNPINEYRTQIVVGTKPF